MSGTRQKEVQLLQLETGSGEVVKKHKDIAASFYADCTSARELLKKARLSDHQEWLGYGSGKQNAPISLLRRWGCDWVAEQAEQAGSKVSTGKLTGMKTQDFTTKT